MKKTIFVSIVLLGQMAMPKAQTQSYFGDYVDTFCYTSLVVAITPNYIKERLNGTVYLHYYKKSNDTLYFYKTNELGEKTNTFYPAYLLKRKDKPVSDGSGCDTYQWYLRSLANPNLNRDFDFVLSTNHSNPEKPMTEVLQLKQVTDKLWFALESNQAENKTIVVKHTNLITEEVELPKGFNFQNLNFIDEQHFVSNKLYGTWLEKHKVYFSPFADSTGYLKDSFALKWNSISNDSYKERIIKENKKHEGQYLGILDKTPLNYLEFSKEKILTSYENLFGGFSKRREGHFEIQENEIVWESTVLYLMDTTGKHLKRVLKYRIVTLTDSHLTLAEYQDGKLSEPIYYIKK